MLGSFVRFSLLALLLCVLPLGALAATHDRKWVGFDNHKNGTWYDQWDARRDFGNTRWFDNHNARIEAGRYLRITLPARRENVGFKAVAAIKPRSAHTCVAKLRFVRGFDWGSRNDIKIPCGLGGGTLPTGGNLDRNNGWTVRFVIIGANRHIGVYAYHADQPRVYGEFFDTGVTAQANRWYTLKLHAKKNSRGKRDGWLGVHVNGVKRIGRTMKWSKNSKNADTVFVTSFRGGAGDPPRRSTFIDVDFVRWY